jgi:hypothetical protein
MTPSSFFVFAALLLCAAIALPEGCPAGAEERHDYLSGFKPFDRVDMTLREIHVWRCDHAEGDVLAPMPRMWVRSTLVQPQDELQTGRPCRWLSEAIEHAPNGELSLFLAEEVTLHAAWDYVAPGSIKSLYVYGTTPKAYVDISATLLRDVRDVKLVNVELMLPHRLVTADHLKLTLQHVHLRQFAVYGDKVVDALELTNVDLELFECDYQALDISTTPTPLRPNYAGRFAWFTLANTGAITYVDYKPWPQANNQRVLGL